MPKELVDENMVERVIGEYLRRLDAPKSLSYKLTTLLRIAKAYRATATELSGKPETLDEKEFEIVIEQKIEVDELSKNLMEQARMEGMVQSKILNERMFNSSQASVILGTDSKSNKRQYANKLRKSGELLGIPHKRNQYVYPVFQFEVQKSRLRPIVSEVNKLLDALDDPWGLASWWITPSERLDGKSPKDMLGKANEREVLDLAKAELEPIG
jgi:hypothetical protein